MKICDGVILAWKDINNRRIRSCLTILAISMGTMLLIAMLSLGDAILDFTKKTKGDIGIINRVSVLPISYEKISEKKNDDNFFIDVEDEKHKNNIDKANISKLNDMKSIFRWDVEAIKNIDGIKYTIPYKKERISEIQIGEGIFKKQKGEILGIEKQDEEYIKNEILNKDTSFNSMEDILLGEEILKDLGIKNTKEVLNKSIKIVVEANNEIDKDSNSKVIIEGIVSGIIEKKSTYCNKILISDEKMKAVRQSLDGNENIEKDIEYDGVDVFIGHEENPIIIVDKITKTTGLVAFSYKIVSTLTDILSGGVKAILSIGGIIVIIIASLGLVNTMAMSIEEKKSIIAVMRAVGANKRDVRLIFIFQGLMIGFLGGSLGGIFSTIVLYLINIIVDIPKTISINISIFNIFISLIITMLITILASLIPANKASKADIIKTLSEE